MQFLKCVLAFLLSSRLLCLPSLTITDNGRLYQATIEQYLAPESIEELKQIILKASSERKTISFAGQRHSQGGHTFCENGLTVDMRSLNHILKIDPEKKTIVVEPGVTWEQIQDAINPYGLAIKVMQASNIFTVGGSLSVNAHGRDPRYGTLIETIRSIKVMKADGIIVTASPYENEDLFKSVIGGYGLIGAIIQAEIELTDNVVYRKEANVVSIQDYPTYFRENILANRGVGLHFARMSLSKKNYLQDLIAVSYIEDDQASCNSLLNAEDHLFQNQIKLFFLRNFEFVKTLRWPLEISAESKEQIITRNQAMRPPVKCLTNNSSYTTDILQEYFVPLDQFVNFTQALQEISQKENINLLNVTIRYVPKDTSSYLPYAQENSFAFVLYINQKFAETPKAIRSTQQLIDAALSCRGTYYLPYQLYATKEQFQATYPTMPFLLQQKQIHDPQTAFSNTFYQAYAN